MLDVVRWRRAGRRRSGGRRAGLSRCNTAALQPGYAVLQPFDEQPGLLKLVSNRVQFCLECLLLLVACGIALGRRAGVG